MGHATGKNYLNESSGIWSWLTTLDHKRIGVMYFIAVMSFFLVGGIIAVDGAEWRAVCLRLISIAQHSP